MTKALKYALGATGLSAAMLAAACGGNGGSGTPSPTPTSTPTPAATIPPSLFTSDNSPAGNHVLVYRRNADGTLTSQVPASYATGGAGTGASLGDQGALTWDAVQNRLLVVNAGDGSVSMLAQGTDGALTLKSHVPVGKNPVSVTAFDDLVYVLNAGVTGTAGSITGFKVAGDQLTPIASSTQPLSAEAPGAAQISFTPDGKVLVVTEKGTNTIDTYVVDANGVAGAPDSQASVGNVPYGFAFAGDGTLLVTEAASGAVSSYTVGANGTLTNVTASSPTSQAAPCWMAATGSYGWAANAGSNSVSAFSVAADHSLTKIGDTATGGKPLDETISADGSLLYVLDGNDHGISAYGISGASLVNEGEIAGLPATEVGLAMN